MNARRLIFATVGSVCVLVCVLVAGVVPAVGAEPPRLASAQLLYPVGLAVDQASGNVYVGEAWEGQVDAFEESGSLLSSFGKAQFGASPGPRGAINPAGVAVDNELSSLSYGDVYVVDDDNSRVDKFTASGEFISMFGGHVNETTDGNVCLAGEACRAGMKGTDDGEFEFGGDDTSYVAVGPGGAVYVGDRGRVQVFEASGVWRENISLAGLASTGKVTALAVESSGNVFVKDEGVAGVREFEPDGTETSVQFDAGSESVRALALGGTGDLFVADSSGGGHVLEYDLTGKELSSLGSDTAEFADGMAYATTSGKLYLSAHEAGGFGAVWVLAPPVPGPPTIEAGSVSAVPAPRGNASMAAKSNPGDFETTYHFEYVDETEFQASGYANASSTPDVSVTPSLEEQSVSVALTGLTGGATYHYRLVAKNSKGTVMSPEQTFEEIPSALLKGPWVVNVASTSATLDAEVDPLGVSTEYQFEYGTSTSYGQTVSGSIGEGEGYVAIGFHNQELAPSMTYHYRLVTHNDFGTVEGADHTFTTQAADAVSTLPDGRVWELVSPANKKGASIEPFQYASEDQIQAASDGSGIAYLTSGPHVGENPRGNEAFAPVLSERGSSGWKTVDLSLASEIPENGEEAAGLGKNSIGSPLFSSNMSLAVAEPLRFGGVPLSPEATERTLYLRDDLNGSYSPLVNAADVPPGTAIEEPTFIHDGVSENPSPWEIHFLTATPDLAHVVFKTPLALVPPAIDEETLQNGLAGRVSGTDGEPVSNLYEWGGGKLQLVNILPNNEATRGSFERVVTLAGTQTGGVEGVPYGAAARAISSDGSRIAWTWGQPYGPKEEVSVSILYVRDMVEGKTVQVGGDGAVFQTMNSEGSRIFYREDGDLYVFDYETNVSTDLTADHGAGEASAGVKEMVSDVSENGSHVYFVATGVLANGGVSGEDNLYLARDTGSGWTTTFIATLSAQDEKDWFDEAHVGSTNLKGVTSRVSSDGRYLAFMSDRSLTGYDNVDAVSGQPDEEVYLYDAQSERLVCASCDPSGARPVGILANEEDLAGDAWENHWLAGSIPGWDQGEADKSTYQPRYLDDSGRLFFNSPDALVPQDTDGLEDVYEYEPPANGDIAESDNCTTVSPTYSERSDGCVNLISSGTSSSESVFYDASENGDDVFFDTTSKLVGEDYDKGLDIYDAHVCSVTVPCVPVPVSPPPCTSGDSCKAGPSPQPEIFGPAPSATFKGVGNVIASPSKPAVVPKSLTRAQKLARALKACHEKKAKKRALCDREARKRYAARPSAKAKRTGKGQG